MVDLAFENEFRRAWNFLTEIHRDGERRSPINYARTRKHKRTKKGKR